MGRSLKSMLPCCDAEDDNDVDDSNVDAVIARNLWKNHRILPPTSKFKQNWDLMMVRSDSGGEPAALLLAHCVLVSCSPPSAATPLLSRCGPLRPAAAQLAAPWWPCTHKSSHCLLPETPPCPDVTSYTLPCALVADASGLLQLRLYSHRKPWNCRLRFSQQRAQHSMRVLCVELASDDVIRGCVATEKCCI